MDAYPFATFSAYRKNDGSEWYKLFWLYIAFECILALRKVFLHQTNGESPISALNAFISLKLDDTHDLQIPPGAAVHKVARKRAETIVQTCLKCMLLLL